MKNLNSGRQPGKPVRIGLIGAGQMGTDVIAETQMMQGIEVVATADIDIERAVAGYQIGQVDGEVVVADTPEQADAAVPAGKRVAVRDYRVITDMQNIDVHARSHRRPRNRHAGGAAGGPQRPRPGHDERRDRYHRWAHSALVCPAERVCSMPWLPEMNPPPAKNCMISPIRWALPLWPPVKAKTIRSTGTAHPADPAIQKEAARRGLSPNMLIEFIDGSKTMIEMAAVSNATGLIPDVRGMHGPDTDRDHLNQTFALKEDGGMLNKMGVVDFGIGRVAPGVFLIVRTDHPRLREAMILRDMGNGPYYTLFRPFHLCSIEVPLTCAMLAIRRKSNMVPLDRLVSEVFAVAKRDLNPAMCWMPSAGRLITA